MATKTAPAAKALKASKAKPVAAPAKKETSALMKPMTLLKDLLAVVGKGPLPRSEVASKLWIYIKKHDLENPANKRNILADDKLKAIFGKDEVTMCEMTKLVAAHLS